MTQLRVTKAAGKGTLRSSIARSIGFSGIARFSGALGQALDVERVLAAWDHLYCYGAVFWSGTLPWSQILGQKSSFWPIHRWSSVQSWAAIVEWQYTKTVSKKAWVGNNLSVQVLKLRLPVGSQTVDD